MFSNERTLHESARAAALEAASRIVADTDQDVYRWVGEKSSETDSRRAQATITMAQHFYRYIIHGDTQV